MTTAETVHAVQKYRFADWFGYSPSGAIACPRYAGGKRCRAWRDDILCICQRHYRLLDHARAWHASDGQAVVTAEPYSASLSDLAELYADLAELGLRATITGRSPWNPRRDRLAHHQKGVHPMTDNNTAADVEKVALAHFQRRIIGLMGMALASVDKPSKRVYREAGEATEQIAADVRIILEHGASEYVKRCERIPGNLAKMLDGGGDAA